MKKVDISRLRKYYGMKLNFSLVIAMSFVLSAFNYTTIREVPEVPGFVLVDPDESIEIERTLYVPKKTIVRPPKIEVTEIIEIDEPEFVDDKKPEVVEVVVDVVPIKQEPIVAPKGPVKKIAPPVVLPEEPEVVVPDIFEGYQVEEMPRFNACEGENLEAKAKQLCSLKAMKMFLRDKLNYPSIARENGIQGTAVISFIVEKDGSISDLNIKHDPGAGLGAEALRVTKAMPKWIPGRQRGRAVRVKFTLPVKFKLN